jgi:hypothetical protein
MSFDMMVFDPGIAPRKRRAFKAWYEDITKWNEGHSYDNPSVSTPRLQAWYMEAINTFPPMKGPWFNPELDEDDSRLTDYGVGSSAIYIAVSYSVAEKSWELFFRLAAKHEVGFFDVSADPADVWFPKNGKLVKSFRV